MDTYLFPDLAPDPELPSQGPQNVRRLYMHLASLWLGGNHFEHDPCTFQEYLTVRGWDQELLLRGKWRDAHPDNASRSDDECVFLAVAVIQSWMTLGFLEDLYQNREWLVQHQYLQPADDSALALLQKVFSYPPFWSILRSSSKGETQALNGKYLGADLAMITLSIPYQTSSFEAEGETEASLVSASHVARIPVLIRDFANAFNGLASLDVYDEERNHTRQPIDPHSGIGAVFRSMMPVFRLIFEVVCFKLGHHKPDVSLYEDASEETFRSLLNRENHWCPYVLNRLRWTTRYSVIHWLSMSNLNSIDRYDHSQLGCTSDACNRLSLSRETDYDEAHDEGCDRRCGRFDMPVADIYQILRSDRVPLIAAKKVPDSPAYELHVTSFDPCNTDEIPPYTALSHVWADGRGSTTERGLPTCQAQFLARVCSLPTSPRQEMTHFWIDSLCVPEDVALRRKAMEYMSETYRCAQRVLVLDHTLQQLSLKDDNGSATSPEHLLLRIFTCPWSFRIWTYQEGVLARELVFLLGNDDRLVLDFPVSFDGGPSRGPLSIRLGRDLMHDVYSYLRAQVQALNGQVQAINIATVAVQLRWRHTLHRRRDGRNDEILATAAVLSLDVAKLFAVTEGEQRIAEFFKQVGRLYRNIVFADAPRLSIDGFRWAISTFLTSDNRRPLPDLAKDGVDCSGSGLTGDYVTFTAANGNPVHFDTDHPLTIVYSQADWFDVTVQSQHLESGRFAFTHIIIYPREVPQSQRGMIIVGAALLEDTSFKVGDDIECVGVFRTVVYLSRLREWDTAVNKTCFPRGVRNIVRGRMQATKMLLR